MIDFSQFNSLLAYEVEITLYYIILYTYTKGNPVFTVL